MLCYVMHEQEGVTWEFFPPKKLPPPTGNVPYGKRSPGRNHMAELPQGRNSTIIMVKLPPLW